MSDVTVTPSIELVQEIVGDLDAPCDYDRLLSCGPSAAGWLMIARCGCGVVAHRLACSGCKDTLMVVEDGLSCPECGNSFVPARTAFTWIEAL